MAGVGDVRVRRRHALASLVVAVAGRTIAALAVGKAEEARATLGARAADHVLATRALTAELGAVLVLAVECAARVAGALLSAFVVRSRESEDGVVAERVAVGLDVKVVGGGALVEKRRREVDHLLGRGRVVRYVVGRCDKHAADPDVDVVGVRGAQCALEMESERAPLVGRGQVLLVLGGEERAASAFRRTKRQLHAHELLLLVVHDEHVDGGVVRLKEAHQYQTIRGRRLECHAHFRLDITNQQ